MNALLETLPDDTFALRDMILSLTGERNQLSFERDQLSSERDTLQRRVDRLQEQIRLLLAKRYGRSSEKVMPNMPSLFDEAELDSLTPAAPESEPEEDAGVVEVAVAGHVRRTRGRPTLPEALPREEILHDRSEERRVGKE